MRVCMAAPGAAYVQGACAVVCLAQIVGPSGEDVFVGGQYVVTEPALGLAHGVLDVGKYLLENYGVDPLGGTDVGCSPIEFVVQGEGIQKRFDDLGTSQAAQGRKANGKALASATEWLQAKNWLDLSGSRFVGPNGPTESSRIKWLQEEAAKLAKGVDRVKYPTPCFITAIEMPVHLWPMGGAA